MKNLLLLISIFSITQLFAQSPENFNYQAVVRNSTGTVLPNKAVQFKIGIYENSSSGTLMYEETHAVTTSAYGVATFQIGAGTVSNGSFGSVNWASKKNFIKVEVDPAGGGNFELLSTTQLVSVPYAMHAETVTNKDDADADTTNEIQQLSFASDIITLSKNGGTADLSAYQTGISNLENKRITDSTNTVLALLAQANKQEADSILLDSKIAGNAASISANSTNIASDYDRDSTNEIQQLSSSNDTLFLSNGGGIVTFTSLITWQWNGSDLYFETGNVAIGHDTPEMPLHVFDSITHSSSTAYPNAILVESKVTNSSGANYAGIYSEVKGTAAYNTAVDGTSDGVSTGTNYGLGGYANNAATNVGVEAFSYGTNKINYGLDGYSWNGTKNYGVRGYAKSKTEKAEDHVGVLAEIEAKNGLGTALWAKSTGTRSGNAIYAESLNDSSNTGIFSYAKSSSSNNEDQYGIQAFATGSSGTGTGIHRGVYGLANGAGTLSRGIEGRATSTASQYNQGVFGYAIGAGTNSNGYNAGVLGEAANHTILNYGILSLNGATGNNNYGAANFAYGSVSGNKKNIGTYGYAWGADTNIAVRAYAKDDLSAVNYGIYSEVAGLSGSLAGRFLGNTRIEGNLTVTGSISKGSGTFKIDHPLDPENKFLIHSFVESPDMMNVYNGNITTDANGFAIVSLADYVEGSNKDFRYQLTPIGQFAQCIVKEEISGNKFVIQTDKPNVKVSWQVTGIRNDPYAKANRIKPVVSKDSNEKGKYLHPKVYGKDDSYNIYQPLDLGNVKEEVEILKKSSKVGDKSSSTYKLDSKEEVEKEEVAHRKDDHL